MDLVADLTLVLLAALAGGFLAQRLGQPLIVGYILAGVAIGPFTGGPTVGNVHDIEQLAELGVALLLFSLGLEVSFRELAPVRAVALGGAIVQIVARPWRSGSGSAQALGLGRGRPALWFGALDLAVEHDGRAQDDSGAGTAGHAVQPGDARHPRGAGPCGGAADDRPAGAERSRRRRCSRSCTAAVRAVVLLGVHRARLDARRAAADGVRGAVEFARAVLPVDDALALGVGYVTWWFGLSLALGAFVAGLVDQRVRIRASGAQRRRRRCATCSACSSSCRSACCSTRRSCGSSAGRSRVVVIAVMRRQGGDSGRRGPRVRLSERRAAGRRPDAVPGWRVCLRARARRARRAARLRATSTRWSLNTAIVTMALTPVVSGLTPALYARALAAGARARRSKRSMSRRPDCPITWSSPARGAWAGASPTRCRPCICRAC